MTPLAQIKRDLPLSAAAERFVAQFEKHPHSNQINGASEWLGRFKREAANRFKALGFPTSRDEEWKFTSLASFSKTVFDPATQGSGVGAERLTAEKIQRLTFGQVKSNQLVFFNGQFCPELSVLRTLPAGTEISSLGMMLWNQPERIRPRLVAEFEREHKTADAFQVLNSAFFENGAYVYLPRGAQVQDPIHLVFVSAALGTPTASHPRNLIVADEGASATVIESYVELPMNGEPRQSYLTNTLTQVVLGDAARVDHYKFQHESDVAFHVGSLRVHQGQSSHFASHVLSLGGSLVRNDVSVLLGGEGAECILNGIYATTGSMHVDNHTVVDHAKPRCSSREFYKGILDGGSRGVFSGKIVVREDAQKSDARQENKNLLLSDDATIHTKPELAILADDVKCTHGATIGRMDSEALFYLRSRGVPEASARSILTAAFASDILSQIQVEPLRQKVAEILAQLFAVGRTA